MARDIKLKLDVDSKTGRTSIKKTSKSLKKLGTTGTAAAKKLSTAFAGAAAKLKLFAVGMTVAAVGAGYFFKKSMNMLDAIGKTADALGLSTAALQEYRHAAELSGVGQEGLNAALAAFAKRLTNARIGKGLLTQYLKDGNPELLEQLKNTENTTEAFDLYMTAMANTTDKLDRMGLSIAAFSTAKMTIMVKEGAEGFKKMRQEARDLGIVFDEKLIRQAEGVNDSLYKVGKVISVTLVEAIGEMAPAIKSLADELIRLKKEGKLDEWAKTTAIVVVTAFGAMIKMAGLFSKAVFYAAMAWNIFKGTAADAVTTSNIENIEGQRKAIAASNKVIEEFTDRLTKAKEALDKLDERAKKMTMLEKIGEAMSVGPGVVPPRTRRPMILSTIKAAEETIAEFKEKIVKANEEIAESQAAIADTTIWGDEAIRGYDEAVENLKSLDTMFDTILDGLNKIKTSATGAAEEVKKVTPPDVPTTEALRAENMLFARRMKHYDTIVDRHREMTRLKDEFDEKYEQSTMSRFAYETMEIEKMAQKYRDAGADKVKVAEWANRQIAKINQTALQEWAASAQTAAEQWSNIMVNAMESVASSITSVFNAALNRQQALDDAQDSTREALEAYNATVGESAEIRAAAHARWMDAIEAERVAQSSLDDVWREYAETFLRDLASMILQQTIINGLKRLAGTETVAASGAATAGLGLETAAVGTLTAAYYSLAAAKAIAGMASRAGGGGGGVTTTARGGVFHMGEQLTQFATGGIVNRPTLFPMQRGVGLMGEAGPEAVMPLRRGAGGRLGVEAQGGQPTNVNVTYNIRAVDAASFAELTRTNPEAIAGPFVQEVQRGNANLLNAIKVGGR